MLMQGLLERLAQGPVIGDGGFVFALEKRGYVKVQVPGRFCEKVVFGELCKVESP